MNAAHITTISKILENIAGYKANDVFVFYMQLMNIEPDKLITNTYTPQYKWESLHMVKMFFKHPQIYRVLIDYITTKKSKIDFLKMYSDEQIKYITNPQRVDTKLFACAGSGKTRSLLGRIKFLVQHHYVRKNNIFAITFSKLAAVKGFHEKIDMGGQFKLCHARLY